MKPFILVTGCGSSGTKYMGAVLRACGLSVKHETRGGTDGLSSWYCGVNKVFTPKETGLHYTLPLHGAMTWRDFPQDRRVVVLHQTRHPLKTISTAQRFSTSSWGFVNRCLHLRGGMPLLLRCMKYWYMWNQKVSEIANFRYKVEDIDKAWPQICEVIERPELIDQISKVTAIRRNVNSRPHKYTPRTWDDLYAQDRDLTDKVKELGRVYGYDC